MVLLIHGDDLHAPGLRVGRVEDLIQSRISLLVVHELDQLGHANVIGLGAEQQAKIASDAAE